MVRLLSALPSDEIEESVIPKLEELIAMHKCKLSVSAAGWANVCELSNGEEILSSEYLLTGELLQTVSKSQESDVFYPGLRGFALVLATALNNSCETSPTWLSSSGPAYISCLLPSCLAETAPAVQAEASAFITSLVRPMTREQLVDAAPVVSVISNK